MEFIIEFETDFQEEKEIKCVFDIFVKVPTNIPISVKKYFKSLTDKMSINDFFLLFFSQFLSFRVGINGQQSCYKNIIQHVMSTSVVKN